MAGSLIQTGSGILTGILILIIRESIAKAGLAGFENRLVSELSDGERQRTMIARVLAQDTDIMIMDEPMAFLDISGKYGIIGLMKELASEGRLSFFLPMNLILQSIRLIRYGL